MEPANGISATEMPERLPRKGKSRFLNITAPSSAPIRQMSLYGTFCPSITRTIISWPYSFYSLAGWPEFCFLQLWQPSTQSSSPASEGYTARSPERCPFTAACACCFRACSIYLGTSVSSMAALLIFPWFRRAVSASS